MEEPMDDTVYCGQCGHPNPSSHNFCNKCGKAIRGALPDGVPSQLPVSPPESPRYEYKSITVAVGLLQNIDKAVDKKVEEMARAGWELVSNTEGRAFNRPKVRSLQFRRVKR
jgi:hypothetical protein